MEIPEIISLTENSSVGLFQLGIYIKNYNWAKFFFILHKKSPPPSLVAGILKFLKETYYALRSSSAGISPRS
jgi:hypothetical protein